MVVTQSFQDIFEASLKAPALSLPTFKQNCLKIEFGEGDEIRAVYDGPEPYLPFAQSKVHHAKITDWRRLTAVHEDCKGIYEVTFDINGSNFEFSPGDTIGVIPHNKLSEVDSIISHLDLSSQASLPYSLTVDTSLKQAKIPPHIPVKSTLRHVLAYCVEIRSVVKKLFILALSRHTKDETERKVLEYLCSKEGSSAYTTHILSKNICILDLFKMFPSCKPPIEILLSHLPRLLPRPYSIANSGLKNPNVIKICFSVMDIGNNRKGLTTSWLEDVVTKELNLENELENLSITGQKNSYKENIPIYVRKNTSGFSMPDNIETPLILIGPGAGIAPFIGFLEEREIMKKKTPQLNFGSTWIFFGCRNPTLDFIYEKELNEFVKNGTLSKLSTAFSRVDGEVKYIQDSLLVNGNELVNLLNNGASVFVCGDLKTMDLQVKETLVQCLVEYDGKSQEEAKQIILEMVKDERYIVDIWT